MRILVVDDDPLAAEMTAAVLEGEGHDCVLAENGVDAMDKLGGDAPFDIVVSDMNMPLASGIDLFRELRGQGVMLPFILLSGDDPAAARAQEPGLDTCLLKDFTLEESLPRAIERVAGRR